ncbi:hypothetical protein [Terribacillus sp. 7520-G]|uniref:hypothetical protein n=1 Tax=Terribacillus sp. 7520-G TaxID=2025389 RepID=UPI000BA778A5|nr:hypothetical protein [Terribacillus sp. 7520-G]PAD39839.1 hypothetical protein CHH53_03915 [Terribacillus sp. 7520-G]
MQQGNLDQFQSYSQFNSLKDFNNSMEQWLLHIKQEKLLTPSQVIAVKALSKWCAKIPGISNARICKIVASTWLNDKIGISRSTFKRAISKCVEFGLLEVHNLSRKNGSQSSNLYVFQPFTTIYDKTKQNEPPKQLNQPQYYESNTIKLNTNKRKNNPETDLAADFTSDSVPKPFKELAASFFNSAKRIEGLWTRVEIAAWKYLCDDKPQDKLETAIVSLQQAVRSLKLGKIKLSFEPYFYGVLECKFNELFLADLNNLQDE